MTRAVVREDYRWFPFTRWWPWRMSAARFYASTAFKLRGRAQRADKREIHSLQRAFGGYRPRVRLSGYAVSGSYRATFDAIKFKQRRALGGAQIGFRP